jgi:predicted DNA-binding transcriptional regulator AlpA
MPKQHTDTAAAAVNAPRVESAASDGDPLMTSASVRAYCGGVSDMCLWRWTRGRAFPLPDKVIGHRKYWRRSTVERWWAAQPAPGDKRTKAA